MSNLQALALKSDGTLYAWGYTDSIGSFGDGNSVGTGSNNVFQRLSVPTRATVLESATAPVVDIAVGRFVSFALRSDGTLWAAGRNIDGELARSDLNLRAVNPAVRIGGVFSKVASPGYPGGRPYAIGLDKALYWWGHKLPSATPQVLIAANVENVWPVSSAADPQVANGLLHSGYALLTDGTVMAWGANPNGELGNGSTVQPAGPVAVALPKIGVRDIARGAAVMTDGSLYLWGVAPSSPARYFKDPKTGVRTRIGLVPVKVATGYASLGLMADGTVAQLDSTFDTDGAVVLTPKPQAATVARHFYSAIVVTYPEPTANRPLGMEIYNSAIVEPSGVVRIKPGSGYAEPPNALVGANGTAVANGNGYYTSSFSAGFTAPPTPSTGSGGGGTGLPPGTGDLDGLAYPQVGYTFTCAATQEQKTVQVSNGPCLSSQRAYAKATSCNEVDSNYSFNSVGRPFYQCLVLNSTGSFKTYYQQYLRYFGG
jgi:hypothetical protein